MRTILFKNAALGLFCLTTIVSLTAAEGPSLDSLQGKWTTKKTNSEGQAYTQTIEIKKDKLTFKIARADGEVRLVAKANVKTEKLGPFNTLKIFDIEAGSSMDALQAVNDERTNIYVLDEDQLTMVVNFDKIRDIRKPSMDTYVREGKSK